MKWNCLRASFRTASILIFISSERAGKSSKPVEISTTGAFRATLFSRGTEFFVFTRVSNHVSRRYLDRLLREKKNVCENKIHRSYKIDNRSSACGRSGAELTTACARVCVSAVDASQSGPLNGVDNFAEHDGVIKTRAIHCGQPRGDEQ